jgi:hypothetical protein
MEMGVLALVSKSGWPKARQTATADVSWRTGQIFIGMRKSIRTKQRHALYVDGSIPSGPARVSRSAFKEPHRHAQIHPPIANRAEAAGTMDATS